MKTAAVFIIGFYLIIVVALTIACMGDPLWAVGRDSWARPGSGWQADLSHPLLASTPYSRAQPNVGGC